MLVIFVTISFRFGIRHGTEQPCLFQSQNDHQNYCVFDILSRDFSLNCLQLMLKHCINRLRESFVITAGREQSRHCARDQADDLSGDASGSGHQSHQKSSSPDVSKGHSQSHSGDADCHLIITGDSPPCEITQTAWEIYRGTLHRH